MTFDASSVFDLDHDDENKVVKGLVMAFMLVVSKQPHMMLEIDRKQFIEFPYECFQLTAAKDPVTDNYTFMLVANEDCERTL